MRRLTDRERRTLRIAAIGVALYLLAFGGLKGWGALEARRQRFAELNAEAEQLGLLMARERARREKLVKLRQGCSLDLGSLKRETLVVEAAAAVQKAAQGLGIQLGPSRELPGRAAAKELALLQLEGVGPTPAAAQLLHGLGSLGVPLIVDSVQLRTTGVSPGQVHLTLSVAVVDIQAFAGQGGSRG